METWKIISGFEQYEVSDLGRVRRIKNGHVMKSGRVPRGYLVIGLSKCGVRYTLSLHRLVALHFIERKDPSFQVDHINDQKDDNRAVNLQWLSCQDNIRKSIAAGAGRAKGEDAGASKLTVAQVLEIRRRWPQTIQRDLATIYGVTKLSIWKIINRRSWRHLEPVQ